MEKNACVHKRIHLEHHTQGALEGKGTHKEIQKKQLDPQQLQDGRQCFVISCRIAKSLRGLKFLSIFGIHLRIVDFHNETIRNPKVWK